MEDKKKLTGPPKPIIIKAKNYKPGKKLKKTKISQHVIPKGVETDSDSNSSSNEILSLEKNNSGSEDIANSIHQTRRSDNEQKTSIKNKHDNSSESESDVRIELQKGNSLNAQLIPLSPPTKGEIICPPEYRSPRNPSRTVSDSEEEPEEILNKKSKKKHKKAKKNKHHSDNEKSFLGINSNIKNMLGDLNKEIDDIDGIMDEAAEGGEEQEEQEQQEEQQEQENSQNESDDKEETSRETSREKEKSYSDEKSVYSEESQSTKKPKFKSHLKKPLVQNKKPVTKRHKSHHEKTPHPHKKQDEKISEKRNRKNSSLEIDFSTKNSATHKVSENPKISHNGKARESKKKNISKIIESLSDEEIRLLEMIANASNEKRKKLAFQLSSKLKNLLLHM